MKRNGYLLFFFAGLVGGSLLQTLISEGAEVLYCRGMHTQPNLTIVIHPDAHVEATLERTDGGYARIAAHFPSVAVEVVPREFPFPGNEAPFTRYSAANGKGNTFQATLAKSPIEGHLKAKIENAEFRGSVDCQMGEPTTIYY